MCVVGKRKTSSTCHRLSISSVEMSSCWELDPVSVKPFGSELAFPSRARTYWRGHWKRNLHTFVQWTASWEAGKSSFPLLVWGSVGFVSLQPSLWGLVSSVGRGCRRPEGLLSLDARSHGLTFSGCCGYLNKGPDYFLPIKIMEILGSKYFLLGFCYRSCPCP